MSISSLLQSIYDSKQAIKASLINKGKAPTNDLSTYSSLIDAIETGSKAKFKQGDLLYADGIRVTDFPLNELDTSEMVSMNSMFKNCSGISTIDISEWDMTKVTYMGIMFKECNADYLVLGTLMPTALTNCSQMFTDSKFKALDLHNLPMNNITDLSSFFYNCTELESVNLTGWNTSNVIDMSNLFSNCNKLTSIDLSSFDTSKVTNMLNLFKGCSMLDSINLTGWNTSNVTNMYGLFSNCHKLTSIDLSSFDTSKLINMSNLFINCNKLTSVDLSSFDTSNVTNMTYLFHGCNMLTSVTGFSVDCDTSSLDIGNAFNVGSSLKSLLFKSGGTMSGRSTNSSSVILDLSKCTALTEASVVAMINSCSANTSGYVRGFKLNSSVYALLTADDIALFTAKNYTVS